MSYWIWTVSGHIILVTTVQRLTFMETQMEESKNCMSNYNVKITETRCQKYTTECITQST